MVHVWLLPPTLWSGVLEHVETEGGFLPPTPLRPGRLARALPNINPFEQNGPCLDPFESNGSYTHKNHAALGKVSFGLLFCSIFDACAV